MTNGVAAARMSAALSISGTLADMATSYFNAKARKAAGEAQARLYLAAASDAMYRGSREAMAIGLKTAALKGTQRADMAANGVALDSVTAVDMVAGTEVIGGIDRATAVDNAKREAWGYQAEAAMAQAGADAISPTGAAAGAGLSGAAKVGAQWSSYTDSFGSDWWKWRG